MGGEEEEEEEEEKEEEDKERTWFASSIIMLGDRALREAELNRVKEACVGWWCR